MKFYYPLLLLQTWRWTHEYSLLEDFTLLFKKTTFYNIEKILMMSWPTHVKKVIIYSKKTSSFQGLYQNRVIKKIFILNCIWKSNFRQLNWHNTYNDGFRCQHEDSWILRLQWENILGEGHFKKLLFHYPFYSTDLATSDFMLLPNL